MGLITEDIVIKPIKEAKTLWVLQLSKLYPQSPAIFS